MDSIYTQMINFALKNGIDLRGLPFKPYTKPKVDTISRVLIYNTTWHNQREIPFQIAHEIGHILNGDDGVYYYSTDRSAQICEGDANRTALHIIVPMYFDGVEPENANLHCFMEDLQIPIWLEHEAHDIIAEYYAA